MCILKCTADVNARAIAERRNGGMFHLIPLTRSTRKVCLAIGRACTSCVCVSIFYFIIRSFASRAAYSDLNDMRSGAIGFVVVIFSLRQELSGPQRYNFAFRAAYSDLKDMRSGAIGLLS